MRARDILRKLKTNDQHNIGVSTLIMQDKMIARLVACWSGVAGRLEPDPNSGEIMPEDTPSTHHVRWLWARVEPDPIPLWLSFAGLPDAPHTRRIVDAIIDNGMVFPDGTMSQWVKGYLEKQQKEAGVPAVQDD